jgi:hypothetical protein
MTTDIRRLYTPVERAVLSKYFRIKDPWPRELAGINVSTPVDPDEWDEDANGIAPLRSDIYERFMLENAVARICLQAFQASLPQWIGWTGVGREISEDPPALRRTVRVRHLFTINWADSGPGGSWPEAYHVARLPGYNVSVVTGSNDSYEMRGYFDFAVGWYRPSRFWRKRIRACIMSWWTESKGQNQARWHQFLEAGLIGAATADRLADAVWKGHKR